MRNTTIYRSDYRTEAEYRQAYSETVKEFGDHKAKVDDGKGGTGWIFFESADDLRTWKNQK